MFVSGEASSSSAGLVDTAFDAFYVTTVRRTLALARSLTRNWSDAEDLVQDAYSDAHRRWDAVQELDDPAAWVRRAVVNRSASRWRRLGREMRAIARLAPRTTVSATDPPLADAALWEAIGSLPGQQRRVVALFYVDDLSVEQIATTLGCSTGTVKTHLSRARSALHAALAPTHEEA